MCEVIGKERCCIVAANLILTCTKRSRTVVITNDNVRICSKSTLEIRSYWCNEYHEQIFLRRMNAHLCTRTNQQRTNVKRGTTLVGRNIFLVQANHFLYHLGEQLRRNFGHHDTSTCTLQTSGILVNTENAHLTVRTTISFQSLESLLTIVQASSCHV